MRIYLLRHAETDSNVQKIIQGTIDTRLNSTGHKQAECLGQRLKQIKPSHLFCSHLQRCRETLRHVTDQQSEEDRIEVTYTQELQERYMGELQGVSKETVEQLCADQKKSKFDFGEPRQDLTHRVETFWRENILPLYSKDADLAMNGRDDVLDSVQLANGHNSEGCIFLCSHGGTLLALTRALSTTFHFTVPQNMQNTKASPNTGVTILNTNSMTMEQYADVSHLLQLGADEAKREAKMEVVDA